jgi:LmbE family N-acetylglucosaminyl deacetylase
MASKPIRLLIVAAHPADSFDQAGGTLAHHAAEGDHVSALILSGGVRSHDWKLVDRHLKSDDGFDVEKEAAEATAPKEDEVRRACGLLGIEDLHFLGLEDDAEMLTQEMVFQVAQKVREIQPNVIITHHPYEEGGFKMHASVGRAALYAQRAAAGSGRLAGKPHVASALYFMSPFAYVHNNSLNQGTGFFRADIAVDISDVVEKKIQAMDCIESQYYGGSYARKCMEMNDASQGNGVGLPYAEQFQRYNPQRCYKLPVSDFELKTAGETRQEMMTRRGYMVDHQATLPKGQQPVTPYKLQRDLYDP